MFGYLYYIRNKKFYIENVGSGYQHYKWTLNYINVMCQNKIVIISTQRYSVT